jgi:hypothetical protein
MIYFGTINLLAVLGAAVAAMVIGSLWYGPLFGSYWIRLMKFTKKDMDKAKKKGMAKYYLINFLAAIVTSYVLSVLVQGGNVPAALITGFFIWIGFFAAVMVGTVIWEGRPLKLYLINVAYWLVNVEAMSVILALWA